MNKLLRLTAVTWLLSIVPFSQVLADIVHNDDVIITFSQCVGNDCVNGETFGFDTVRLKENNLRIKFQDTSSTASFPSNDWQITANDSSNGGQNKFSIDDIDGGRTPFTIEASAPSHSLYVDDGGRLGLGTSIPVTDVHVKTGNTPTYRMEQDGSSGFTPQTWDVASNETNFFIRDATNGSTLPFRIRPGAPTSAIDIAASGYVGIGATPAQTKLHVHNGSSAAALRLSAGGTSNNPNHAWDIITNPTTGRMTFFAPGKGPPPFKFDPQAQANLLRIGVVAADRVDIKGKLVINGTPINVPDYVFDPAYPLESIEEHSALMWEQRHLPALPSASESGNGVDILSHQMGVLEELEKAHIYIANLNTALKELQSEMMLREKVIDELQDRVSLLMKRK